MHQTPGCYPLIGVAAVVWRDERVLLVRRGRPPRQGEWSLPGGRQEWGERVREAVQREVREETGIEIEVQAIVDVVDLIDRDEASGAVRFHYTLIDTLAEWRSGEARPADDADAVAWVTLDELPTYQLWHETERIIRQAATMRAAGMTTNAPAPSAQRRA
ncbi:NUDIX hydrolase [Kallotenue papyrolyticum]|uniref:NUDIX hydrolase n=1 Tax=Kallotenue papyrolyticum TaxID=1325125 RepID=UPI0004B6B76B|nr:NUDIX hydrolase [Kallotenue papyrolyticum]